MIVLCAKMSIDQIEGTWEEMSCPIVSSSYRSIISVEGGRKTSTSGMSGVLKNLANHLHIIILSITVLIKDYR